MERPVGIGEVRPGEADLDSRVGRRLLAHELTHVVQQKLPSLGAFGLGYLLGLKRA